MQKFHHGLTKSTGIDLVWKFRYFVKTADLSSNLLSVTFNFVLPVFVLWHCFVVATASALTRTPRNAIGLQKDTIIMECFTDSSYITWRYDSSSVTGRRCQFTIVGSGLTTTADSNATHCSLVVQGTNTTRLSGPYYCSDGSETAEAVVIIIGQFTVLPLY